MKHINADEQERIMLKNEMIETNDWVEVVRCKDCVLYDDGCCRLSKWAMCREPDEFCSRGKKRKTK